MGEDLPAPGPQGNKSTSANEHHGEDSTTGMGGSTAGASAPSEENQAHGKSASLRLVRRLSICLDIYLEHVLKDTDKHASGHANK